MRKDFRFSWILKQTEALMADTLDFNLLFHIHKRAGFQPEPGPERPFIPRQPLAMLVQQTGVMAQPELPFRSGLEPIDDGLLERWSEQGG